MIAERTGESLEAIQNLSLEEKVHLVQALGLKQVLSLSNTTLDQLWFVKVGGEGRSLNPSLNLVYYICT